jgi:hypothetical protein
MENPVEDLKEKKRTAFLPTLRDDKELGKRVSNHHGWCKIENLSGDYEEGIFMATFADDFKQVFEYDGTNLRFMFTKDQEHIWYKELSTEEQIAILEEVAYFFIGR